MIRGVQPIPTVAAEQMREVDIGLIFSQSHLIRLDPQGRTVPDGR